MPKYRKRPGEPIEVEQYKGPERLEPGTYINASTPGGIRWIRDHYNGCRYPHLNGRQVKVGDMILTHPNGTREVMRPGAFAEAYEVVGEEEGGAGGRA